MGAISSTEESSRVPITGQLLLNKQYLRNPDMVYVLKMEYVSNINIFGLKMKVKSGQEKIFLKFLHAQSSFQTYWFSS